MDKLLIKLEEQRRIYKASPTKTATYVDIVHLIEDLIDYLVLNKKDKNEQPN